MCEIVVQMPQAQVEDVLVKHPEWKAQLTEFAQKQKSVPAHVKTVLGC